MCTPNQDTRAVILSFDLSQEEFTEIPQPDDHPNNKILVGIMDDCLCVLGKKNYYWFNIWIMQKYNVKQSWKMVDYNCSVKFHSVVKLTELNNGVSSGRSTQINTWFFKNRNFTCVPNYTTVESLVRIPSSLSTQ